MTNATLLRSVRTVTQHCVPNALRKVAPLFSDAHRVRILSAAHICEREPTLQSIEAARDCVHKAAHDAPTGSAGSAAGHAAAYACAAAYAALEAYEAYVNIQTERDVGRK